MRKRRIKMKSGLAKWLSLLFLIPILGLVFALGCGEYKGSDCAEEIAENGFCVFTTGQKGYEAKITASDCTNIAGSATVDPGDPINADFKFVFWAADSLPANLPYVVVDKCWIEIPALGIDKKEIECGINKVEPKIGSDATLTVTETVYYNNRAWVEELERSIFSDGVYYYIIKLTIGARPAFSTNYVEETSYSWVTVSCKSEGGGP